MGISTRVVKGHKTANSSVHLVKGSHNYKHEIVTLEQREVLALFKSDCLSERERGTDISVSTLRALSTAFWKDSEMVVG